MPVATKAKPGAKATAKEKSEVRARQETRRLVMQVRNLVRVVRRVARRNGYRVDREAVLPAVKALEALARRIGANEAEIAKAKR